MNYPVGCVGDSAQSGAVNGLSGLFRLAEESTLFAARCGLVLDTFVTNSARQLFR